MDLKEALIQAADAATNYEARNEGEATHVAFIRSGLADVIQRAAYLDDYAAEHDRARAIHEANDARAAAEAQLAAAQSA